VAIKVRPGPELLQKCAQPMLPDPARPIVYNSEALVDLAEKFAECQARQARLVDWFGEP